MGSFLGGFAVGTILVAGAAAYISLTNPLPQRPDVVSRAPQSAGGIDVTEQASGQTPAGQDADLVEIAPRAPEGSSDDADTLASLDGADTQPADKPAVGEASGALDKPQEGAAPAVEVSGDAPVAPVAPSTAPEEPIGEAQPSVSTELPSPPAVPGAGDAIAGLTAPDAGGTSPELSASGDGDTGSGLSPVPATAPDSEAAPTADTQPAAPPAAEPAPEAVATETPAEPAPAPEAEPEVAESDTTPEAPPPPPDATVEAPQIAALPQTEADEDGSGPTIGKRVVPLTERNRPAPEPEAPDTDAAAADVPEGPPIEAFAADFEPQDDRPLMAIVLIDDEAALGGEALREFPYPLSFAVDPTDPQSVAKMQRHREAGFEVVAIADLPPAATAQDAEVSMSVWLDALPQTVAILEGTGTGIQGNRALSDQITAIADGTGRGLITQDNGLNTVQKLAARDGVPAAVVFRDFDGAGQTPTVMRRFLDQAAFRAGQEGAVIMLGRVRPDTISALLLWGLQDRARRVELAPVSAVLTREQN